MIAAGQRSASIEQQPPDTANKSMRKHVRGSALLLSGRICSLLLNMATQVVIVRALSKTDYGALGYALSLVEMFTIGALISPPPPARRARSFS